MISPEILLGADFVFQVQLLFGELVLELGDFHQNAVAFSIAIFAA